MNKSKMRNPRHRRKLYESGAVKQKEYPEGSLFIDAMSHHRGGSAAGYTVLSLGNQVLSPGCSAPLCSVVVPTHKKYRLGVVLSEVPKHAVPVDLFFRT